jgi:hypothetical protein
LKRFLVVLSLALVLSLAFAGAAFANFGPHGGYIEDTDSCAGCHRAHTSFSDVTFRPRITPPGWDDADNPSALLVGSAATMTEFCNACHGDLAPGASTNVVSGIFDSGPSTPDDPGGDGVPNAYVTASTFGAPLNGGGFSEAASIVDWETSATAAFEAVTSTHSMERVGVLWGAGNTVVGNTMNLNCASCHDPHGSSNYRLLKDDVNGQAVGGYAPDGTPTGMVFSVETGYDDVYASGGWLKHQPGQDQMAVYVPDYTSGSSDIRAGVAGASLSAWCSACHQQYDEQSGPYNYAGFEGGGAVGSQTRHRHPVDITLTQGDDILQIAAQADGVLDRRIPLEVNPGVADNRQNQLGCLTCHYAHGSNAEMSGWSDAHLVQNATGTWVPSRDTTDGVDPDKDDVHDDGVPMDGSSALLRADNRGVCERCHDK